MHAGSGDRHRGRVNDQGGRRRGREGRRYQVAGGGAAGGGRATFSLDGFVLGPTPSTSPPSSFVGLLEMLLHLVGSGELLLADGAGKDFSSGAFVIQEGVPLD